MPRRSIKDPDFIACVLPAAAIGGVWGYLFRWFTPDEWVFFWLALFGQTCVMLLVFILLYARRIRKRVRPSITPGMIDHPSELYRHATAQMFNTGKPVIAWYDDDGKMRLREQELPRVPITVTDKHGKVIDGTAAAFVTVVEEVDGRRHLSGRLGDVRDLDGNVLPVPPGGRLDGTIEG